MALQNHADGEHTIAPELEERSKTSSSLVTHSKGTTAQRSITRACNVVLEDTLAAVVGEAFAQLDNGDQESSLGERLADFAKSQKLFGGWADATKAVVFLVVAVDTVNTDRASRAVAVVVVLDDLLLDFDVGTNIVVVHRSTKQVRLVVRLVVCVHQLLSATRS
jgi:hypothetical protein